MTISHILPQAYLILEPKAGQSDTEQDLHIIQKLLLSDLNLSIQFTSTEVSAKELAQEAIQKNVDLVLALGGDGTVSTVAGVLMGSGIPLGIIPRGTSNAVATVLGIPMTLEGACNTILKGNIRAVDGVLCNQQPILSSIGIGFEADALARVNTQDKENYGIFSYGIASLQELIKGMSTFDACIEVGNQQAEFSASAITIANATSAFSFLAYGDPEVIVDDGLLDVTIICPEDALDAIASTLALLKSAFFNVAIERPSIAHFRVPSLKVTTNPPLPVALDGDLMSKTPIEVTCCAKQLKIFAPKSS